MTKPVIIKRGVKGQALTYAELDQNFQNLDDATITVTGDTGSIVNNLNDSFKVSGGTGLTSSVSGTTLTLNLDNTAVTAGSYTLTNLTVDAQGRITAASSGTIPTASGSTLGGIKVGSGLSIDGSGVLSVTGNSNVDYTQVSTEGITSFGISTNTTDFLQSDSADMTIRNANSGNSSYIEFNSGGGSTPNSLTLNVPAGYSGPSAILALQAGSNSSTAGYGQIKAYSPFVLYQKASGDYIDGPSYGGGALLWDAASYQFKYYDDNPSSPGWKVVSSGSIAANALTGTTLASNVVSSSLTSVGTLTSLNSSGLVRFTQGGNGSSYNHSSNAVNITGTLGVSANIFTNGNVDITAGSAYYIGGSYVINGNSLGSAITGSSLTSVGTLSSLTVSGTTTSTIPVLGKTSYNVALDTVVTVDNIKYRISNQGGIFPQIASASGSQVDVCYAGVGVINGATNPAYANNSGYLLAAAGTWLSIYSTHGMDTRSDYLTFHITDKNASKIYRVTFLVTNNSSNTTGYNIVVERII